MPGLFQFCIDHSLGTAQVVLLGSEGLPEGAVLSLKSGLTVCQRFANSPCFYCDKTAAGGVT